MVCGLVERKIIMQKRRTQKEIRRISPSGEQEKNCLECRKWKPMSAFQKNKGYKDGRTYYCRKCNNDKASERMRRDRRVNITRQLKCKYGVTLEEVEKMKKSQQGKCYICERDVEILQVDHNHITGKVRGLLCFKCNAGIGMFQDSIVLLRKAAIYLDENN